MEEYIAVMNLRQTKDNFMVDLIDAISPLSKEVIRSRYNQERWQTTNNFKVDADEWALIRKVHWMLFERGGLMPVIDMLMSFAIKGKKRIKSNKYCGYSKDCDSEPFWEEKSGNEKLRHRCNLDRAHFRWDFGGRYELQYLTVMQIFEFIAPLVRLRKENYFKLPTQLNEILR